MNTEYPLKKWQFTSESVSEGHPDKVCDQISDAILDELLRQDPLSRVACEVAVTTGMVLVMGEVTTEGYCDIPAIVRKTVRQIGYDSAEYGFDAESCAVLVSIKEQSADIAMGVNRALEVRDSADLMSTGAGDQGMMFGYANNDTPELMPLPISLAHQLSRRLAEVRKADPKSPICPDGKTQVTITYEGFTPVHIDDVVVSTQHRESCSREELEALIRAEVIAPVLPKHLWDENTRILINPSGRFVIGGPSGDSGLTGRKIIVDTYGGFARHGGGAFSGKDPTKVDRSAAYAARYLAKNIVASGLADRCEIQLAYAIGVAKPLAVSVDSFGSGKFSDATLSTWLNEHVDLRPDAIIARFNLRRPLYQQTAVYGHFGRLDLDLPWEEVNLAPELKSAYERGELGKA